MIKKVIDSIKSELDLYQQNMDEKHLYAVEKLLEILKEDGSTEKKNSVEYTPDKGDFKLDDSYIAGDSKSTSIFDF